MRKMTWWDEKRNYCIDKSIAWYAELQEFYDPILYEIFHNYTQSVFKVSYIVHFSFISKNTYVEKFHNKINTRKTEKRVFFRNNK